MPRGGNSTDRGYGWTHARERAQWVPLVAAGDVSCWRCRVLIDPDEPWDLGHDDDDRGRYRGPEHRHCNRSAAATRGNRMRGLRRRRPRPSIRESWPL